MDASQTNLTVADASTFPATGVFRVIVDDEIMVVSTRSGAVFTVTRGGEGTTPASHTAGQFVTHVITAGAVDEIKKDAIWVNGHPDPSKVSLTWTEGTRTLTITPTMGSYDVVSGGIRRAVTTTQNAQIGTGAGTWFIYWDSSGTLVTSQTAWNIITDAPVASVYWNGSASITVGYELHGDAVNGPPMDNRTHQALHYGVGAAYASGLAIGTQITTSAPNADGRHVCLSLTGGVVYDEDIAIGITNGTGTARWEQDLGTYPFPVAAVSASDCAKIPVVYMSGASTWNKSTATVYPFVFGGTNTPQINQYSGGTWSLVEASNARFVAYWIFATNDISDPIVAVPGTAQYGSIGECAFGQNENAIFAGRTTPFSVESRLLYRVIFEVQSAWDAGSKHARIVRVDDFRASAPSVDTSSLLAWIGSDGPPGSYYEITGQPFPTAKRWWTDSSKTTLMFEKLIVRNGSQVPTSITFKLYATDGVTVIGTLVDTPDGNILTASGTRT